MEDFCTILATLSIWNYFKLKKKLKIKALVPKMNEINMLSIFLFEYYMHIVNIFYLYVLSKAYLFTSLWIQFQHDLFIHLKL